MNNKIKKIIILLLLLYLNINIFSINNNYISLTDFIENNDFKIDTNLDLNLIKIIKQDKSVSLIINSPYILLDNKKLFIYGLISSQKNMILIPDNISTIIKEYLNSTNSSFNPFLAIKKNKKNYYLDSPHNNLTDNNKNKTAIIINDNKKNNNSNDQINVNDKYIYDNKSPENIKINAIIIDPGHGGSDPGAIGYSGIKEKDIVLKAGLLLYENLCKKYPDKKIILTRNSDISLSLDKRAKIANYVFDKYGPSLFISIHVNASRSNKSYGFETWYLVEEYRRNIIKEGEISSDSDVEQVLNSMLNDEIYKESKFLASKIQHYLNNEIGDVSADRGIKEQTYFVIKKSIMPAVLVEIGFNTNKYEEIRLTKSEYLNKITNAILYGINDFIKIYEQTNGYTK